MALNTPAKFGRALNFGRPNPLPMWNKSQEAEYPFPNLLGWNAVFQVEAIVVPVVPNYGPPFIDAVASIEPYLSLDSRFEMVITRRAKVIDMLDGEALMPSIRITRSVK